MRTASVTPLILTYNEQSNLNACLQHLTWAKQVLIVDSYSTDDTIAIAKRYDNVKLVQRKFDNHTEQWNFGLEQVSTPWVITMDADYICNDDLAQEIRETEPGLPAYAIGFDFAIYGRKLRSSIYPPRIAFFETNQFRYEQDGHTQLLSIPENTTVGLLKAKFTHDDRKSISRWVTSQVKYADLEVRKLLERTDPNFGWKDWVRSQYLLAAPATLFYCLFVKRLILDGWAGIFYTFQRTFAELLLSLKLLESKLKEPK